MFESVKEAIGNYLQGFYKEIIPTTKALKEFNARGFSYSFVFAPSRMIDQAQLMLDAWQRNDTTKLSTTAAKLPVIIVAVAKDYFPTGRDYTLQIADSIPVMIQSDPKKRYFELKTIAGDIRVQLAICASDEATAKSLASQLLLYVDSPMRRGFDARYTFAGNDVNFPCQIDSPDSPASSIDTGNRNLTILAIDFNLHCTIPLYQAPKEGDYNDGKGTSKDDPSGYPLNEITNIKDQSTIVNGLDASIH